MKKHKVDELFSTKLNNWEPKPSKDLWSKIEARQQSEKQKNRFAWTWYAAAGISLALIAGYSVWEQNNPDNRITTFATTSSSPVIDQEEQASPRTSQSAPDPVEPGVQKAIAQPDPATKATLKSRTIEGSVSLQKPSGETPKVIASTSSELATLPSSQPVKPVPAVANPEESLNFKVAHALALTSAQTVREEPLPKAPPTETVVVVVEVDQVEKNNVKKKPSRFKRILAQLRNVKGGEKIEWNEVGVNPAELLAKADESLRIRSEEVKQSKQYKTIKDKINL